MSLTGALYNAFSGLTANARAASLVSTNIANATTEGYGRRTLNLSPGVAGTNGGVVINGVDRQVDPVVIADRRLSDAQLGFASDAQSFATRMEKALGDSSEAGSLMGRLSAFENAITLAGSNPASEQRLIAVGYAARDLTTTLNGLSDQVQQARTDADRSIATQVDALNTSLTKIDEINDKISLALARGGDTAALMDSRQVLIDGISDIVPLRVVQRDRGQVALFTTGGAILLDGRPAEIEFSPATLVTAGDTQANGALSGLTVNGKPANTTSSGLFAGGTLAAQFEIRDETGAAVQAQLDGIARDLIERFGPGGPDASIAPGQAGLFTDAGTPFDPLNEEGISDRISLNSIVDPVGGEVWRLRDGLYVAAQGEVGDARLLNAMSGALDELRAPSSTALAPTARGFPQIVAEFASFITGARVRADGEQSFATAQHTALREIELSTGVDTDQELQSLLRIEQQYAANARVMSVVDDLMQTLINI